MVDERPFQVTEHLYTIPDRVPARYFNGGFVSFTRDRHRRMRDLSSVRGTQDLFASLFEFFTMMADDEEDLCTLLGPRGIFKYWLNEVSWEGISYFTTERGLVGMATTAVQAGDWLCAVPDLPVYLILREVHRFAMYGSNKHRIIARAAVLCVPRLG
ncbi:hypothetical protein F5Y11DRAFT_317906 [Daldinia sp. FL1419]|nr:hypothetical protein F5Y11DRAFT_317906 [Daldinia sp. FL1419]